MAATRPSRPPARRRASVRGRRRRLPGREWVKEGILGATSQHIRCSWPSDGVQAVAEYIKTGKKPTSKDTGEELVTDKPVSGVPSMT